MEVAAAANQEWGLCQGGREAPYLEPLPRELSREVFYDLKLISAHREGGGARPNSQNCSGSVSRGALGEPKWGATKKMDPSRSPVVADRSEIKSDRERCA